MNAQEQREKCPVRIGGEYKGGTVTFILGDSRGWGIWVKVLGLGLTHEMYYRIKSKV